MKTRVGNVRKYLAVLLAIAAMGISCEDEPLQGEEKAELVAPPGAPSPIRRSHPTKVVVNLETNERTLPLADGVEYTFWMFGGAVPGPLLRVRQGDLVEFHLSNHPSSQNPHNIDLHAVTGPGGGAHSSLVAPGQSATFVFKALNPGLFVYHCATAPVGMHVANGMYGLVLVEPKNGLPAVDREYYLMQGEFYTRDENGTPGHQSFDMRKALAENPSYVVFNGAVGALADDRALTAQVGETVRLFVGNGGPNLISSFHVIGEIFDRVWHEAGTVVNRNVQTTVIPAGGAAMIEFALEVPGTFILVDHSLFRAFNKGALGILQVEGQDNPEVYSGRIDEGVYKPEGGAIQSIAAPAIRPPRARTTAERVEFGRRVYAQACTACHQPKGVGIPGVFPPLAGADYLNEEVKRAIHAVINGLSGPITVNGVQYNSVMPATDLSDESAANVLTYVYSQWGNAGAVVTPEQIRAERERGRR
ncbi:MAG: copper-containing nitrite reductase [Gammaproteobacteria bacterium]